MFVDVLRNLKEEHRKTFLELQGIAKRQIVRIIVHTRLSCFSAIDLIR